MQLPTCPRCASGRPSACKAATKQRGASSATEASGTHAASSVRSLPGWPLRTTTSPACACKTQPRASVTHCPPCNRSISRKLSLSQSKCCRTLCESRHCRRPSTRPLPNSCICAQPCPRPGRRQKLCCAAKPPAGVSLMRDADFWLGCQWAFMANGAFRWQNRAWKAVQSLAANPFSQLSASLERCLFCYGFDSGKTRKTVRCRCFRGFEFALVL